MGAQQPERKEWTWHFDDYSMMIGIQGNKAFITIGCAVALLDRVIAQLMAEREASAGGLLNEAEEIKRTISNTLTHEGHG